MVWTDQQFVFTLQLSFIGIILVVGLFMIWRLIQRTETRVAALSDYVAMGHEALTNKLAGLHDLLKQQQVANANVNSHGGRYLLPDEDEDEGEGEGEEEEEDDESPDLIIGPDQLIAEMKSIFGGNGFPSFRGGESQETGVHIIDIADEDSIPPAAPEPQPKVHAPVVTEHDEVSVASTKNYSKTKLLKMNLDGLREVLSSRGLPTEGVKKDLIDRIIHGGNVVDEDAA